MGRAALLALLVPLSACLGGRRRLDEWTPVSATQRAEVWSQGREYQLHAVTVLLDSITGIPYDRPLWCDSCRIGIPRARVDSAFVSRGMNPRTPPPPDVTVHDTEHDGGLAAMLGGGAGTGTIACGDCAHAGSMNGESWTIQIAQRVNPHVRLGWSIDTWTHSAAAWERGILDLNALFFYYPSKQMRFFVGGGPSYSLMYASVTDSSALQRHGWGFTSELGYDLRLSRTISVTPFAQYSRAWVGDIYYPLGSAIPWARDWKHQVLTLGLGATFHNRHHVH